MGKLIHLRCAALAAMALVSCAKVLCAAALPIPDQPPAPPELAGRWMEKTAEQKGSSTRYLLYVFTRKSEFTAFGAAFDGKTKKWSGAAKIFKGGELVWNGYVQSTGTDALTLHAMPHALFPAVFPVAVKYRLDGDTLTFQPSLAAPDAKKPAVLKRVARFPDGIESESNKAVLDKKIADGLLGDEFRKWFAMGLREASDHPGDEEMARNFREHREDFETLRAMMREEKEAGDFSYEDSPPDAPPEGLSQERFERYRALFQKLNLQRGVSGFGSRKQAEFNASSRGMLNSGSSKKYVWREEPPPKEQTVESIDDTVEKYRAKRRAYLDQHGHGAPNEYFTIYRRLEGNWWIEYRH